MIKFLAATALLLAVPLGAQTLAKPELPGWMAGTWAMQDGASWADEIWSDPRGGIMLGMARTGFGTELQGWEVTQIKVKTDGTFSFFAQTHGKAPSVFRLVLISVVSIEFANPAHDYPQRIR